MQVGRVAVGIGDIVLKGQRRGNHLGAERNLTRIRTEDVVEPQQSVGNSTPIVRIDGDAAGSFLRGIRRGSA